MDTASTAGIVGGGLLLALVVIVVSGLIVGALARWALPGPDPMSWPKTLMFGIGGSLLGGVIARLLSLGSVLSTVASVACAAGLIWFFTRRKSPTP